MNNILRLLFINQCRVIGITFIFFFLTASCKQGRQVYQSDCDEEQTFKKVSFNHLLDSINDYNQLYVEITGRYQEGKNLSALYSDSSLVNTGNKALWVNFSQDCELYLSGTQKGFFNYNTGDLNQKVRIRGKIDAQNQGHLKQFKGCIDRVSLIELRN